MPDCSAILVNLAADARYADDTLSVVENLPDESLVLLAMTLRDRFGLLAASPAKAVVAATPIEEKPVATAPYHLSGARS